MFSKNYQLNPAVSRVSSFYRSVKWFRAQIICFSPQSTNLQTESNQILAHSISSLHSPPLPPAPLPLLAPHCLNSHPISPQNYFLTPIILS